MGYASGYFSTAFHQRPPDRQELRNYDRRPEYDPEGDAAPNRADMGDRIEVLGVTFFSPAFRV
jgi:hypothetical protein